MVKVSLSVAAAIGLLGVCLGGVVSYHQANDNSPKYLTVGKTASVSLPELGLTYSAVIDTGEPISQLSVDAIEPVGLSVEVQEVGVLTTQPLAGGSSVIAVGDQVRFRSRNERNQSVVYQAKVVDVVTPIKAPVDLAPASPAQQLSSDLGQGRYIVELDIEWHGLNKRSQVRLIRDVGVDQSLVIGRDWLAGDVLVNVEALID